ncbi:putative calmodulin [Trypanosoma cruzi]|uniref:Calmodulin, putative n=2 Tax=Trypanosoma cruzi TaxID=5693 RepID=Q4CWX4_TRYCC|nr:calmodulin, putative [Trypanosoma cruzi]EAN84774.1 calmodulin, putative [Trypanosoma cruzi]KAF8294249.1 putative calmodulin [Trypanosoma cruzi]PWV14269.1 putative calmodulin [Trypanosoma cruzi]|eukprot:XP_806625.1 calmodulin [Trypanosoma cruzi strain CL Brener]
MDHSISQKELDEFREMFDLVDTNHSGRITRGELRKLIKTLQLRPTEQELEQMFSDAEANESANEINFDEFVALMSRRLQSDYTLEQLRNAFKLFETEDMPPGYVSREVLEHALVSYGTEKLTHDEATRLLAAVDPEGTGRINYIEFVSLVGGGDP